MEESDWYCLLGLIFLLLFLAGIAVLFRAVIRTGETVGIRDFIGLFREARDSGERLLILLLATTYASKKAYFLCLAAIAGGGFTVLGTICGVLDLEALLEFLLDLIALLTRDR